MSGYQRRPECVGWESVSLVSALGLAEQAPDPADQGLDEGVAGADLAVQALHLQQLPLQGLSEARRHVALQLEDTREHSCE